MTQSAAVASATSDKASCVQLGVLGALLERLLQRLMQLTFIIVILIMFMRNMLVVTFILHIFLLLLLVFHQFAELVQLILQCLGLGRLLLLWARVPVAGDSLVL